MLAGTHLCLQRKLGQLRNRFLADYLLDYGMRWALLHHAKPVCRPKVRSPSQNVSGSAAPSLRARSDPTRPIVAGRTRWSTRVYSRRRPERSNPEVPNDRLGTYLENCGEWPTHSILRLAARLQPPSGVLEMACKIGLQVQIRRRPDNGSQRTLTVLPGLPAVSRAAEPGEVVEVCSLVFHPGYLGVFPEAVSCLAFQP